MIIKEKILCNVHNISKTEENKKILNNISFEIPSNKIIAFLGPNGAGKTTTLRVLSGLTKYDEGDIYIDDQKISKEKNNSIMLLPDTPLLFPVLTGKEYLSFVSELLDFKITEEEVLYFASKFNLLDSLNLPIFKYSLGMKKKLSLLPLLIKKPKLLLLDEYISGIDPISMKEIKDVLKNYVKNNKSIILSTHQLEIAQTFCDSIILIEKGIILKNNIPVEEIISNENSLEEYFIKNLSKT